MTRRDVKVIQPGLVYVIEWAAGADPPVFDEGAPDERERRRARRERRRSDRERAVGADGADEDDDEDEPGNYIYVACVPLHSPYLSPP